MHNKYLYSFLKDGTFRLACIFSIIGIIFCVFLFRLDMSQALELKNVQNKQTMIAQIPMLQDKITSMQGAINGLVLNGIVSDKKAQPMAAINNILVKVGEEVDGKKVVAITDREVKVCNISNMDQCTVLQLQE